MTIAQIIVLVLAGPIGLICLSKLIAFFVVKEVSDFHLAHAVILVICAVAIVVSFLGIK